MFEVSVLESRTLPHRVAFFVLKKNIVVIILLTVGALAMAGLQSTKAYC
jgi:capsular polysaccharide biosynthesis protein